MDLPTDEICEEFLPQDVTRTLPTSSTREIKKAFPGPRGIQVLKARFEKLVLVEAMYAPNACTGLLDWWNHRRSGALLHSCRNHHGILLCVA
jgi:hypothetical protein